MTVQNIEPVNSVLKHCKNSKCSLRDINNMCYGICNDFDNNTECKQKCKDFIYQQNYKLDNKQCPTKYFPKPPVIFNNVSDNFTPYIDKLSPENSIQKCINDCSKDPYVNECINKCNLNYNSITEKFKHYESSCKKQIDIDKNILLNKYFTFINTILSIIIIFYLLNFLNISL
jgi:hypothetical protein